MKILIIDDEEPACRILTKKILALHPELDLRSETNPLLAVERIYSWSPDVVFLDVQMPVLDGFALLNLIPEEKRKFALVFCTAYSEYAVKAFEESAIDYLLKPVEPERLEKTLRKIREESQGLTSFGTSPQKLEQLISKSFLSKIYVKLRGVHSFLNVNEISCFISETHETVVLYNNKEYICDLSLGSLESKLDPERFFRCHRGTIVNLAKVQAFEKNSATLQISGCSREIEVSKRNRSEFLKKVRKFVGSRE